MIWLWRSLGSYRARMLLLPSYYYLCVTMALYILVLDILVTVIPAQCLLRNQISRSLFSSLEEVWLYFYLRVRRNSPGYDVRSNIQGGYFPHSIFIEQIVYQWPAEAWEKKLTQEELWRLRDHHGECHFTPESIVMVSGWHRCSWHRYQDASDTRPKTRPALDTLIVIWVGGGPEGQKIWKNKRNQPQQSLSRPLKNSRGTPN